jgi:hypothetical protein
VAQFKGSIFTSTRIFTEKTYGQVGVERCLARLQPADRALLEGISPVGWYPAEPILSFHHALEALYGEPGNHQVCEAAGRYSAEWAFNSILKIFLRFKTPHWLMTKYTSVWERYHDSGNWELGVVNENALWGRLSEYQVCDRCFCARLRGWIQGAVHMTGGQDVRVVESRCRCDGSPYCHFDITWR